MHITLNLRTLPLLQVTEPWQCSLNNKELIMLQTLVEKEHGCLLKLLFILGLKCILIHFYSFSPNPYFLYVCLPTEVFPVMMLQKLAKDYWISEVFFFLKIFISTHGNIFNTDCHTVEKDVLHILCSV